MNLEKWMVAIAKGDMPGNYLSIATELRCPSCHVKISLIKIKERTEGYLITKADREGQINRQIAQLSKTWTCPACGIVSALPAIDLAMFAEELQATITPQWLERHE